MSGSCRIFLIDNGCDMESNHRAARFISIVDDAMDFVEERLLYALLLSMLIVVFLGVLNRYVLPFSMRWTEELARYLMIWVAFIGSSLCVRKSLHISVDALVNVFPETVKKWLELLAYIICMLFCVWLFLISYGLVERLATTGQLSPSMRVPVYYAYAAVPVGFALMSIRYFIKILKFSVHKV